LQRPFLHPTPQYLFSLSVHANALKSVAVVLLWSNMLHIIWYVYLSLQLDMRDTAVLMMRLALLCSLLVFLPSLVSAIPIVNNGTDTQASTVSG
jgi:hypothetical protein